MTTPDPVEQLQRVDLVCRITDHAVRTWLLGEWALLRRVMPDGSSSERDPSRFMPDRGSSLGFDDLGFMSHIGDRVVSSTARYPVMSAAENLVGAGQVHSAHFQERRVATASVATLCRSAMESSAKTIWLLSDVSREVRRARCLGFIENELAPQMKFINLQQRVFEIRNDPDRASDYENFQRHRRDYEQRKKMLQELPRKDRQKPRAYEDVVKLSAEWIDANPPPHAESQLPAVGVALAAQSFYSFGSSFVHGYKWMRDYVTGDLQLLKMIAEGFAAALIMTECAVALFEAQAACAARVDLRKENYPQWLAPTVDEWAPRYR